MLMNQPLNQLLGTYSFETAVENYPNHIAIYSDGQTITYHQLNEYALQLASVLRDYGITENAIVALSLENNIAQIALIIAIQKLGTAYMPVEVSFPEERIKYMLELAQPSLFITDAASILASNFTNILSWKHCNEACKAKPTKEPIPNIQGQFSYILFTSGSTGRPKGVLMNRIASDNLIAWQIKDSTLSASSKTLQFSPLTFDVSFQEIFSTLAIGGTLYCVEDSIKSDADKLLHFIAEQKIERIFLPFVALQALCDAAVAASLYPASLREVMTAGEQLKITPQLISFFTQHKEAILFNHYGPTEAHVVSSLKLEGTPHLWPELPSIGKPISNSRLLILDAQGNELGIDEPGELYIGGLPLAAGYIHQQDLTNECFVLLQNITTEKKRFYKTGDIALKTKEGNYEFLGRVDDQIKIRGYRVELGEIESRLLQQGSISQAAVTVLDKDTPQQKLVAYLIASGSEKNTAEIKTYLNQYLPEYMIPTFFMWVDDFPKTSSGKIDRKALPKPVFTRPTTQSFIAPKTVIEHKLVEVWQAVLGFDSIGIDDNFFELGGSSLTVLKTAATLRSQHNIHLSVVKLYQYPTIRQLAASLEGATSKALRQLPVKENREEIAVIGMAGRFPGANTINEFWDLLTQGRETIQFFSDEELDSTIDSVVSGQTAYVKARGIVPQVTSFDAGFFGVNPNQAKLMDPQQRIFLEVAWETLESSGYAKNNNHLSIGVYAGVNTNSYFVNNVLAHPDLIAQTGQLQTTLLNDKDYVATRTAYSLNLKGPAVTIQTACSTSLVAIAQAVQSIRNGYCDMAIAGGASVTVPIKSGHVYEEGAMFSRDGHCRPFDAHASGTCFSDGAGAVLLKSKEQAIKDGDTIYAVINGIGLSNDGGSKGSFSAPSVEGQAAAISMAIQDAGIEATAIGYVEAHGTATPLGDPIEIYGLKLAFGTTQEKQYCAIGSIKGNMGHLTMAAGIAGFMKTCLSLYHQQLLPSINFSQPNPHINFTDSPFYVNTHLQAWKGNKKRIAGVSSFGVGGTNAHIILSEALPVKEAYESSSTLPATLICWSAMTENSSRNYAQQLADYLKSHPDEILTDIAYTLHTTRKDFPYRRYIVATDKAHLIEHLQAATTSDVHSLIKTPQQLVFMFPGQGDQYVNMGRSLYASEQVFKAAIDECAHLLKEDCHLDLLHLLFVEEHLEEAKENINQTQNSQPALFAIGYALGKLWMSWGIFPAALVGHSIGEFVAAYFAGVFSLRDALRLISERGRMMGTLSSGKMLSVRLSADELNKILPADVSLAAINSTTLSVVAGTHEAIANFSELLKAKEVPYKALATSHAFHSYMMDELLTPFESFAATVTYKEPLLPIASTVTGKWLQSSEAMSPAYWAKHMRSTVQFVPAIQLLVEEAYDLFVEIGPGSSVSTFTRQLTVGKDITVVTSLEKPESLLPSRQAIHRALGQLWMQGYAPDWTAYYENYKKRKLQDLPTYAFDRKEYWLPSRRVQLKESEQATLSSLVVELKQTKEADTVNKRESLITKIKEVIERASGIEVSQVAMDKSFIEIGLDSLALTQVALLLKKRFAVAISFRQLNETLTTIQLLANYIEQHTDATIEIARPSSQMKTATLSVEEDIEIKKPFGAIARIDTKVTTIESLQQQYLTEFTQRYNQKTQKSKTYTQAHRVHMADPRVVSGFRPGTKELVYSLVVNKSKGCRIWDMDGNEYIDSLNGFGSSMLGYQPDFLKKALLQQIDNGYEIGPQHELAGEVCQQICEFTHFDRAALCNTGSEAVLGAMRIARTVTGRSLIIAFTGSYHGINDEVIARSSKSQKTLPAAPGILPEAVQNMLFLEYGTSETLKIIEEKSEEIAAILVEPVQSRRCDFQPITFLKQLRRVATASKAVLIFDEIISGFRFHTGGVQSLFGVQADIATYGKVIGGGLSIGAIAGKKQFMDALDGGWWQFGDASIPEVGVTYFAGTFVRHPLALATANATLKYFSECGPELQQGLNQKGTYLSSALNAICVKLEVPMYIAQYCSLWRIHFTEEYSYVELFFALMRLKGIHILEGFPCFITTAHTQEDLDEIIRCFEASITELRLYGLIPFYKHRSSKVKNLNSPPVAQARLGVDKEGNPAWFVPDESAPGRYCQIVEAP